MSYPMSQIGTDNFPYAGVYNYGKWSSQWSRDGKLMPSSTVLVEAGNASSTPAV